MKIDMDIIGRKDFLERLAADTGRRTQRGILRATLAAESLVVKEEPYRSGNLRSGTTSTLDGSGTKTVGIVRVTAPYGIHVHEGTGIFGPRKAPIVPRIKRALAFTTGGRRIVRRSVKGQRPNPFVTRAANKLDKEGIAAKAFWEGFNAD